MQVTPLGDGALILRVRESYDAPEEAAQQVLDALHRIRKAQIPGIIELAPAYTTVTVFFDPIVLFEQGIEAANLTSWLTDRIQEAVARPGRRHHGERPRSFDVPVCFDPEFALDLQDVAAHSGISAAEVVKQYCRATYRVGCIGFTPGFPYLAGLPENLAIPRRANPRKEVPAGSVAIGGTQTGIYPAKSPGGWHIIGRTPLRLFDSAKNPPALLQTGDVIHFHAMTGQEFKAATE